ncbi:MAG TPA: YciI family protein [Egibacteraceae bacterium]|nr:YciI family protein [Egibacteraceae bacterium]
MRYLLLIYTTETGGDLDPSDPAVQEEMEAYGKFTADLQGSGAMLAGEALHPTSTATSVQVRDGETVTTDGPFAETKEALGGFYMVEAADLDEAIGWAARIPGARRGTIEVRPIMEIPQ